MYNIYFENHECHPIYGWLSFTVLIYFDLLLGAHSMKTHSKQQTPFTFHACSQLWIHRTSETNWKKAHQNIESCCGIRINQCGGGSLIFVISVGFGYLKTSQSKNYWVQVLGKEKFRVKDLPVLGISKKAWKNPHAFTKDPIKDLVVFGRLFEFFLRTMVICNNMVFDFLLTIVISLIPRICDFDEVAIIHKNDLARFGYIVDMKVEKRKSKPFYILGCLLELIKNKIWRFGKFLFPKSGKFGLIFPWKILCMGIQVTYPCPATWCRVH